MIIFRRKIYDRMLQWKRERDGKTALLIKGARRIGKSVIAEEFAKNEYQSYIKIDFSETSPEVRELFNDVSDLNYIFFRLQLIFGVNLIERKSVIILDEIQLAPMARQAIKHLVKDGRYDYIETGSLISITKKSKEIVIPSEETKINMYPMDYEEFKWALGDNVTIDLLREAFQNKRPLGEAVHRKMMRDFRVYMAVGGMPQAVSEYIASNDMSKVDIVKREILELYNEDFMKLDESGHAAALYDAIPAQLGKNTSRYMVSSVLSGEKIDRTSSIIKLMKDSMTTNVSYLSTDPNIGLALTADNNRFKLYTSDTGLFITLVFKDDSETSDSIYQKLFIDKLSINLGYVYENMVAQMLTATGKQLFYNIIPTNEGKKYYEIDFLISEGHKICPIEVKSGGYKTHVSLDVFCEKYSERIKNKYLIYTKDLRWEKGVLYLPVYMTMFL